MHIEVDSHSPVPLYHQLVEAIRYRVATGKLRPGTRLPAVRTAAAEWGVHLHTVRRAYGELAKCGLLEVRRPGGTIVADTPLGQSNGLMSLAVRREVAAFLKHVRKTYQITPQQVVDVINALHSGSEITARRQVTVVECNRPQAEDYARQLEAEWNVTAVPWTLEASGEPKPGPILSTYFHYNDIRTRWPERLDDMFFVSVRPDPALGQQLLAGRRARASRTVLLGETDAARAENILPDLKRALGIHRLNIEVRVHHSPACLVESVSNQLIVLAPRLWARLGPRAKQSKRLFKLRYLLNGPDVQDVANRLGWGRLAKVLVSDG